MFIKFLKATTLLIGSAFVTAQASPVLSFSPSPQTFIVDDSALVNVVISGLEDGLSEIVSAFDLSISYDDSILGFSSINIYENPFDDMFWGSPLFGSDTSTMGIINFNLASFASDADLQTAQGGSIILATLAFDTLTTGISSLGFDSIDVTGLNFSPLTIAALDGEISVNNVPLPAALPLMLSAVGVAGFLGSRRKNLAAS